MGKTSQDFREVVFQLTGYRIDGQQDSFLFDKAEDGQICMLESEFSLEMGDLMQEHLERNNSIPMFLAAVIMKLFDNQHQVIDLEGYKDGDTEEQLEEEDEDLEDNENENDDDDDDNDDESGDSSSENSNESDEIIEIDD